MSTEQANKLYDVVVLHNFSPGDELTVSDASTVFVFQRFAEHDGILHAVLTVKGTEEPLYALPMHEVLKRCSRNGERLWIRDTPPTAEAGKAYVYRGLVNKNGTWHIALTDPSTGTQYEIPRCLALRNGNGVSLRGTRVHTDAYLAARERLRKARHRLQKAKDVERMTKTAEREIQRAERAVQKAKLAVKKVSRSNDLRPGDMLQFEGEDAVYIFHGVTDQDGSPYMVLTERGTDTLRYVPIRDEFGVFQLVGSLFTHEPQGEPHD